MKKRWIRGMAMALIVIMTGTCFVGCKKDKCDNCGATENVKSVKVSEDEKMMLCPDCKVCDLCGDIGEWETFEILRQKITVCDDCK